MIRRHLPREARVSYHLSLIVSRSEYGAHQALKADDIPELKDSMEAYRHHLGYVPNSPLVLARRPRVVKALAQMASAVWDKESSEVKPGFKRLVAYMASRAHGWKVGKHCPEG